MLAEISVLLLVALSILNPNINLPPEKEAELSKPATTVMEYFRDFGYPDLSLMCYTINFKEPYNTENCITNEAKLKAGFNIEYPNDYTNAFCENMHFYFNPTEFDCLTAAFEVYVSGSPNEGFSEEFIANLTDSNENEDTEESNTEDSNDSNGDNKESEEDGEEGEEE
jgi:hypothetical protein